MKKTACCAVFNGHQAGFVNRVQFEEKMQKRGMLQHDLNSSSEYGTPDRWWILVFVALDYFILYLHRNLINYIQPPLKAELQLDDVQLPMLQTAFIIAYCLSQLFVGYLGDRFTRRNILIFSLLGSVLSLAGTSLVSGYAELVAMRVILGISQAASVPAIGGIIGDTFTARNRSTAVGVYLCSQQCGLMIAARYGGRMADVENWHIPLSRFGMVDVEFSGWRMAMLMFALLGSVVVVAVMLWLREPARTDRHKGRGLGTQGGSIVRTTLSVLRVPSYLMLLLIFVLAGMINNTREFWLARFFHDQYGMTNEDAGTLATFYVQPSTMIGLLVGGVLADALARRWRSGRSLISMTGILLWVPAYLVLGSGADDAILKGALMTLGLGYAFYAGNLWTTTFEVVDPAARSTALAWLNVGSIAASSMSPTIGYLVKAGTIAMYQTWLLLSLIAFVAALLFVVHILYSLPRDYREPL